MKTWMFYSLAVVFGLLLAFTAVAGGEMAVMVTYMSGDVQVALDSKPWTPMLGETLAEGSILSIPQGASITLVNLKNRREFQVVESPTLTTLTVENSGLKDIPESNWGPPIDGLPQDLAMSSDGTQQVGARRADTLTEGNSTFDAVQQEKKEKEESAKEAARKQLEESAKAAVEEAQGNKKMVMQSRAKSLSVPGGDNYFDGPKSVNGVAPSGSGQPEQRGSGGSAVQSDSVADGIGDTTQPSGSTGSICPGTAQEPPPPPPPPAPMTESPPAKPSESKSADFEAGGRGIQPPLWVGFHGFCGKAEDADLKLVIEKKEFSLVLEPAPISGWVMINLSKYRADIRGNQGVLKITAKNRKIVVVDPSVDNDVMGALKLEAKGYVEQAAGIWLNLLRLKKTSEAIVKTNLSRFESRLKDLK